MKSAIIGMGIGSLYKNELLKISNVVLTVDTNEELNVHYRNHLDLIKIHKNIDTVNICVPNFLHEKIARDLAPHSKIIFVEKPGLENSDAWFNLCNDFPNTRFMMTKNNMWRSNIGYLRELAKDSISVKINWINKNRIPKPGSWFTNKKLAYGGVSRDLMPHLLSLFASLNKNLSNCSIVEHYSKQKHTLDTIETSEYGKVDKNGIYDVDDLCYINILNDEKYWHLEANWADNKEDNRSIEFFFDNNMIGKIELGLCPEKAYLNMLQDAMKNIDNDAWWAEQFEIDMWIHKILEKF